MSCEIVDLNTTADVTNLTERETQKEASSPSLSAKKPPGGRMFAEILPFRWDGPSWCALLRWQFLLQHTPRHWNVDVQLLCCCQRADQLVVVEDSCRWFLLLLFVERKRQCSERSSKAHRTVSTSSTRNNRLLRPAPAKAITASRRTCRSPVGPGELMGASVACGNEESPVLFRSRTCLSARAAVTRSGCVR